MDYEKKYKEALNRASKLKVQNPFDTVSQMMEYIFPNLKESEDERIRKSLIDMLKNDEKCYLKEIAWLEKQDNKFIPEDVSEAALQYVDNCPVDGEVEHDNITEPYWNNHSMMNAYKAGWLKKQGKTDSSIKWHDVSEKPEKNREILCEWVGSNNCIWHDTVFYNPDNEAFWNYGRQVDYVTRWCYVDDIKKQYEQKETLCGKCRKEQPSHSCQDITELGRCALEKQGGQKPVISDDALREGITHFGITQYQIDNWLKKYVNVGKQGGQKEYTFKSIPRLLDMIEPTSSAKVYCQKLIDALVKEGYTVDAKIVGDCLKQMNGETVPMATMDEQQKQTDTPKFREGEWVAYNHNPNLSPRKIIQITNKHYVFNNDRFEFKTLEADWHLWTIQDAKDGDVLVTEDGRPFIYKGCLDSKHPNSPVAYCGIDFENVFFICESKTNWWTDLKVQPATKEQCDTLMKAMADAGYEWDAENKELKKIEQKPWSEEDEAGFADTLWAIQQARTIAKDENDMGNLWYAEHWLKSIKDRVQPQPKQEENKGNLGGISSNWSDEDKKKLNRIYMLLAEAADEHAFSTTCRLIGDKECVDLQDFLRSLKPQPKQEWSEEDALRLEEVICMIEANGRWVRSDDAVKSVLDWLKSLKEKYTWKPNEEQMDALEIAISSLQSTALESLYNKLKNL